MRLSALLLLVCVAVALALAASCGGGDAGSSMEPRTAQSGLPLVEVRYHGGTLQVEYANTPQAHARGLGERDALAPDSGMIFDLGSDRIPRFWMKGMRFPLDMIWIAADGRIAGITADVQPQPGALDSELRYYSPDVAVRYVLEVNAGASRRLGLAPGETLSFELPDMP
jgi:uncharacterized membrane protein (UPF0127 family)